MSITLTVPLVPGASTARLYGTLYVELKPVLALHTALLCVHRAVMTAPLLSCWNEYA